MTKPMRYAIACTSPEATQLAAYYETAPFWHASKPYKAALQTRVLELFAEIPLPVLKTEMEPYATAEEMRCDISRTKLFKVRARGQKHPVLGKFMTEFRAVHDWFGHALHDDASFTFNGEMRAFNYHASNGNFDAWLLPFVWCNVVLENAFMANRGHWHQNVPKCPWCMSKVAFDETKFGPFDPIYGSVG